jgi:3-hexulose-6-phosphate synthase/6-phospho-3-hexuloisomerase
MKRPVLQVALDLLSAEQALRIGREALAGGADWVEAGTPLIKSEGVKAVWLLKDMLDCFVVADMKVMDAGALECSLAFDAGADMVTLLGSATRRTVADAVAEARKRGKRIAADLIGAYDLIDAYERMEPFDLDYIYVHSGLDEQVEGKTPFAALERLSHSRIPLGVAGGISARNVRQLKHRRVAVVVVGAAITKAKEPRKATKRIVEMLDSL